MTEDSQRPTAPPSPRYGIRVTHVCWFAIDGGPDLVGTRDEMIRVQQRAQSDPYGTGDPEYPGSVTMYEVVEYAGNDPADRATVEDFLARKSGSQR